MQHYLDEKIYQENGFNALRRFHRDQGYACLFCGYKAVGEHRHREHVQQDAGIPALFAEPSSGKLCCYKSACQEKLQWLTQKKTLIPLIEILAQQERKRNHFRETAKTKLAVS